MLLLFLLFVVSGYWNEICVIISSSVCCLTDWGRVTHICIGKLTVIGSDNGLSPGRRQAIIWTNAGILIRPLGTNVSEMLIGIQAFSFKKMYLKMSSAKWRPFCPGLNMLTLLVLRPEYSERTTSVTWLLISGSLHRQDIDSNSIGNVAWNSHCLP